MQVSAFCIDWNEVLKRDSAEQIVDEMILSDDIDDYAIELPSGSWLSDSASQHFEAAEQVKEAISAFPNHAELEDVANIISTGDALDELGISGLTEGCYFISISPARVLSLSRSFNRLYVEGIPLLSSDSKDWIAQWGSALDYASANGYGLIGHCG